MRLSKNTLNDLLLFTENKVLNYIIPGLSSSMLGSKTSSGTCVRLFENSRHQIQEITPHSHRFDFQCLVLSGEVENRLWYKSPDGDPFGLAEIEFDSGEKLGKHLKHVAKHVQADLWTYNSKFFTEGEWYGMSHDEIHSISFSKDAIVLFFEGPQLTSKSNILLPLINGEVIDTFKIEPWMFVQS